METISRIPSLGEVIVFTVCLLISIAGILYQVRASKKKEVLS
jgi:hypothetical protein